MKKTALLSACVLTLAASTLYFARELHALQSGEPTPLAAEGLSAAQLSAAAASATPPPAPELTSPANPAVPVTAAAPPSAAVIPPANAANRTRERAAEAAREFLDRYDNPETRKSLIDDELIAARRNFALFQSRVALDKERWEKFLRLTVDLEIDRRVRAARCWIDPACERPESPPGYGDQQRQKMADLIGEKNVGKFEVFMRERPQADTLAKLQDRLGPTLELPPDQLRNLSNALEQEVDRTRRELRGRGAKDRAFRGSHGPIVYSADTKTLDERMESASASVQRLRDRAGALLDGERLRIFNLMLDDALLKFRARARTEIAIVAAGYER